MPSEYQRVPEKKATTKPKVRNPSRKETKLGGGLLEGARKGLQSLDERMNKAGA